MTFLTVAKYELLQLSRDRSIYVLLFAMPLLIIFILGSALSAIFTPSDVDVEQVELAIVATDQEVMPEAMSQFFENPDIAPYMMIRHFADRKDVVSDIKAGQVDYGLVVPSDFSTAMLQGEPVKWELIRGKNQMKNITAETILQSFAQFIEQRDVLQGKLDSEHEGAQASHVTIGHLGQSDREFSAMQYYAAQMLIMFLLYTGMGTAISLVKEKEDYTLTRLSSMPIRINQVLLGKLLGNGLVSVFQAAFIIGGTALLYGVDWGSSYLHLALICLLVILASKGIAIITMALFKTVKAINIIFQVLIILMTFLSGGFSLEFGEFFKFLAPFTINEWAVDSMLQMMLYDDASAYRNQILILGFIAMGIMAASLMTYRKAGYR